MNDSQTQSPQRQKLPHGIPSWVRDDAIFFVTVVCATRRTNQLCNDKVAMMIWESVEFRQRRGDWYVHLCLLMPDHLHALVSFPKDKNPAKMIANWKENVAKATEVLWQRDYFDHRLRSNESYDEKARYILQNPVRKALVSDPKDWDFIWEPH